MNQMDISGGGGPRTMMAGKFVIRLAKDGQFYFTLFSDSGQKLLMSEMYRAKASAYNGITSIQKNASDVKRYDRLVARNGKNYFTLKAANHEIIGMSDFFDNEGTRDLAILTVMRCAPDANVEEEFSMMSAAAAAGSGSGTAAATATAPATATQTQTIAAPSKRTKAEIVKSIEARKLHPRTLRAISSEPVVISFGAIIEKVQEDDRRIQFMYLGQPYETDPARAKGALRFID
jgi:uncharacterized protein